VQSEVKVSRLAYVAEAARRFIEGTGLSSPEAVVQAGLKSIRAWCEVLAETRAMHGVLEYLRLETTPPKVVPRYMSLDVERSLNRPRARVARPRAPQTES